MKHKRKSKRKKDKTCDVKGCDEDKKKSLSTTKIKKKTDLKVESSGGRNSYLCKEHYKEYKKATEDERRAKRLSWD
ncbi:MAG: hypothetical protein KGY66_03615 [Candidatus Thermoplasmatota archaeon]|nr:hypothetical protein [Candidatus Thermoplasmatota archaeon]MBS3789984.1 hypothetical protein [Candidatus Thermoplasmatota archaeon]